ncbi:MAG: nucleoside triphosphate pyrophosphohydrolase family protein [Patescibacteria group bacterium]
MSNLTFKEIIQKTNEVIKAFEKVEQRKWGAEGSMIELMKQVGELSKNVMMLENYYLAEKNNDPNFNKASKDEIGNELSDIFFMLVRIANHYGVDLETTHLKELDLALRYLEKK